LLYGDRETVCLLWSPTLHPRAFPSVCEGLSEYHLDLVLASVVDQGDKRFSR
jgi:hypothetical protein